MDTHLCSIEQTHYRNHDNNDDKRPQSSNKTSTDASNTHLFMTRNDNSCDDNKENLFIFMYASILDISVNDAFMKLQLHLNNTKAILQENKRTMNKNLEDISAVFATSNQNYINDNIDTRKSYHDNNNDTNKWTDPQRAYQLWY